MIVGQWLHTKRQVVLKVRRGRDRMMVGFTTICAINAYHHVSSNRRGVFNATLCDKVCQ